MFAAGRSSVWQEVKEKCEEMKEKEKESKPENELEEVDERAYCAGMDALISYAEEQLKK